MKHVRRFSLLFIWKRLLLVSHGKSNSRRAGFEISHRNYGRRIYMRVFQPTTDTKFAHCEEKICRMAMSFMGYDRINSKKV